MKVITPTFHFGVMFSSPTKLVLLPNFQRLRLPLVHMLFGATRKTNRATENRQLMSDYHSGARKGGLSWVVFKSYEADRDSRDEIGQALLTYLAVEKKACNFQPENLRTQNFLVKNSREVGKLGVFFLEKKWL